MNARLLQADLPAAGPGADPSDRHLVARRTVELPRGRTLAFAQTGSGPDLVAIHGTLTTLEDLWLGPVPALSRHFRVVAIDRPGHGRSERRRLTDASLWHQAALIRDAVRELGLHRPVLLGHSYGGAAALACAMLEPDEVAGVVAIAPPCFPEPRIEQFLFGPRAVPMAGETLSNMLSATTDPAVLRAVWTAIFSPQPMPANFAENFPFVMAARSSQLVAEGEDAAALPADLMRSALSYPACRVPVRFLAGDRDRVVNPFVHARTAAQLMPNARFDLLPGLGHMLHHFAVDTVVDAARAVSQAATLLASAA